MYAAPTAPEAVFARLIEEGFNQGRLERLSEIVAPDLIEHQFGAESGLDGLIALIRGLREPFPDLHLAIQATATTGDIVWARIRARGTNTGSLWGRPATGASMDITVIDVARVVDGCIVEHWGVADRLGMLQQLGIAVGRRPATTVAAEG
jgi:predicted SnoaL-like aldol condensation-catalyzing enzyme